MRPESGKKKRKKTYGGVRDGVGGERRGGRRQEEAVLERVGGEPHGGGEEEHEGKRQVEEGQAGGPSEGLAEVGCGGEVGERLLGDGHGGLERGGVGGEVEVGPRQRLHPDRRHQRRPPPPLPVLVPVAPPPHAALHWVNLLPARERTREDASSSSSSLGPSPPLPASCPASGLFSYLPSHF